MTQGRGFPFPSSLDASDPRRARPRVDGDRRRRACRRGRSFLLHVCVALGGVLTVCLVPQRKAADKEKAPRKAKKDKNAPKRALSAYMFFSQDWRERVKAENPDAGFGA